MRSWARTLAAGAAGGALATITMSGVMWAAGSAGLMGRQPPRRITEEAAEAADAEEAGERELDVAAAVAHVAFGSAMGVAFTAVDRAVRPPLPPAVVGAGFGLALWGVSYGGVIPALGILPPSPEDREDRQASMVAAHLVYGVTLARFVRSWVTR